MSRRRFPSRNFFVLLLANNAHQAMLFFALLSAAPPSPGRDYAD